MDKWGANIDIVFRNGLKDFEVLPPPEAWNNIQPFVKTNRSRPFHLAQAAALITVLVSLGFFAYRMSADVSAELENKIIAFNVEAASPLYETFVASEPAVRESGKPYYVDTDDISTVITVVETEERVAGVKYNSLENLKNTQTTGNSESASFGELRIRANSSSKRTTYVYKELYTPELDVQSTVKNKERWSIGAIASPTYFGMAGSGDNESASQLKSLEQSVTSYTGGVSFSYKLSKRFSIQSGIYYSSLGQEVEGINSFVGFQQYDFTKGSRNFEVMTSRGKVYTNNADVFLLAEGPEGRVITNFTNDLFDPKKANLQYINNSILQSFSYLELPLILRYKFVDRTIGLNLIGGISYNMLMGNNVYANVDGGKFDIGKTEGLSPISISSSLGMGMEYSFSQSFSLNLEPTFRYYLNPFNVSAGSNMHPYSFGIFSGVTYKF